MIGFVKLSREILAWEWYSHPTVSRLYIHLLTKANFEPKRWQGIIIKRGQLVTSLKHLSYDLDLSVQQIRTALEKLESTNMITRQPHTRFTLLTLIDYEKSQGESMQTRVQSTNKKQSNNTVLTTTKESKEVNKEKNIEKRKMDFKQEVFKYSNYQEKNLIAFYDYWSEMDEEQLKMKFEDQPFFEIEKRLKSWMKKDKMWQNTKTKKNTLSTNR